MQILPVWVRGLALILKTEIWAYFVGYIAHITKEMLHDSIVTHLIFHCCFTGEF